MLNIKKTVHLLAAATFLAGSMTPVAMAQQSGESELDKCVAKQQLKSALKGAGAGLIGGLLVPDDGKDKLKNAAIGGAIGAAGGFALAYFTANEKCLRKNPHLVKASDVVFDTDIAGAKKELKYDPEKKKVALKATRLTVVEAGTKKGDIDLTAEFIVLTPDSAEIPVTWAITAHLLKPDGTQEEVKMGWYKDGPRTVQQGRNKIVQHLPFPEPKDGPVTYRFEFSVAVGGQNNLDKAPYESRTVTQFTLE